MGYKISAKKGIDIVKALYGNHKTLTPEMLSMASFVRSDSLAIALALVPT